MYTELSNLHAFLPVFYENDIYFARVFNKVYFSSIIFYRFYYTPLRLIEYRSES